MQIPESQYRLLCKQTVSIPGLVFCLRYHLGSVLTLPATIFKRVLSGYSSHSDFNIRHTCTITQTHDPHYQETILGYQTVVCKSQTIEESELVAVTCG